MDSANADRAPATALELTGSWTAPVATWSAHEAATYVTDRLHPGVFRVFVGTYGAMLLLLWLLFGSNAEAGISLGVCTAYFAVYFGVPWAMNRLANSVEPQPAPSSFRRFLRGDLLTYTGRISGMGAMVQMLIVPVGIVFAFACIGVIIRMTSY